MVKKRFVTLVGCGIGAIALVVGGVVVFAQSPRSVNLIHVPKTTKLAHSSQTAHIAASWGEWYKSITDLKAHTDVAVAGHFTKVLSQTTGDMGIPYTDFAFTVDSALYDPNGKVLGVGSVLRVHQTGGVVGAVTEDVSDDPLFAIGEKAVLFLREYQPGFFLVAGGPSGRFEVSSTGAVSPINNGGVVFSGSLDSFAALVKSS